MNERINQLAKSVQCERHWNEEDIEKFAELIVRECAKVVDDKLDFDFATGPDDWATGDDLLEHFGIEE